MDCENKFVCVYCVNREHKQHKHDTLINQATSTRTLMSTELKKIMEDSSRSTINYQDEMEKVSTVRDKMEVELEERMLKELNKHAVKLSAAKEKLLAEFDDSINRYKSYLNDLCLIGKDFQEAFSSFIEQALEKPDYELLSERDGIIDKSKTFSSAHCFNATLTNEHGADENYLGQLKTNSFINEEAENNEIFQFCCDSNYNDALQKIEDLNNLVKCLNGKNF